VPPPGTALPREHGTNVFGKKLSVLDIVYVLVAVAAFAVVGMVARAVERL
jgi:hypothetical protein